MSVLERKLLTEFSVKFKRLFSFGLDSMNGYALLMIAIICGMIGASIGQSRKCGVTGFSAGLFLGPLGWLLVLFNDQRRQCSECKGRIPDGASRCQHRGVVVETPKPLPTPPPPENILETYKAWKEKKTWQRIATAFDV
jgi:hypothetical protein